MVQTYFNAKAEVLILIKEIYEEIKWERRGPKMRLLDVKENDIQLASVSDEGVEDRVVWRIGWLTTNC